MLAVYAKMKGQGEATSSRLESEGERKRGNLNAPALTKKETHERGRERGRKSGERGGEVCV